MNIKILSSLTSQTESRNTTLTIGTHNGIFHSDEILACAILCLINSNLPIQILRTRNFNMLIQCDICIDIGGGKFDHHQSGFNQKRKNGTKYASAGLIWNSFGKQLIKFVLEKHFPNFTCNINAIFETFDNYFVSPVDCEDNGIQAQNHRLSFISSFLPLWFNNNQDDFNKQFYQVLVITMKIVEQELKTTIGKEIAKATIESNWNSTNYFKDGILEIPSQTMDWVETVISINDSTESRKINFVIFPYPDGGWAAQCVPPSLENKFAKRIPFPAIWAGKTDTLSKISGIDGATFCHNGCFFVRATNKEDVTKMCSIATDSVH